MSVHKIYSKKQENKLLHMIYKLENNSVPREDIVPAEEFLQVSCIKLKNNKTFDPHEHVYKTGEPKVIAQESWVVIKGKVKFSAFDLGGQLLEEHILNAGDCSITLYGGHNYEALEDNTIVYEYKTGPYKGQELDKKSLFQDKKI